MDGHKKRIGGHSQKPRRTGNQTLNKEKRGNQNNAEVVIALK
jgi:hypothetical protein